VSCTEAANNTGEETRCDARALPGGERQVFGLKWLMLSPAIVVTAPMLHHIVVSVSFAWIRTASASTS
jgi:hypothetical protein